jgi:hypothetical protein
MILDMIQGCRYLRKSTDRWLLSKNSTTRLKDSKVGGGPVCCEIVRSLLQAPRVYIYTLVLTRLLVDYEYNIHCLNLCPGANVHLASVINSSLPYIQATSSRILECFLFQAQTALLPNNGALPTASIFTESFKENFLPNGASLPNSAHKSVPFLYQFLVLTHSASGLRIGKVPFG